jgi:hypothetical protein
LTPADCDFAHLGLSSRWWAAIRQARDVAED